MTRIALVTGANRGIGREVCRQLALAGIDTILTARNTASGRETARELGLEFMQLDVTDDVSVRRLAESVEKRYGRLDILVNNAGVSEDPGGALDGDVEGMRETMDVNCFGALRVCRALAPVLRRSDDGRIINVSSKMALFREIRGNHAGYRLSKAALNALTVLMAAELEGSSVTVNAVTPGHVRTDMGGPDATLSVEEGAAHVVRLATVEGPLPSGRFFAGRNEMPW